MAALNQITRTFLVALILGMVVGTQASAAELATKSSSTKVYVKNDTNKAFTFELYVQTTSGKLGRFGKQITVSPGKAANWNLGNRFQVAAMNKNGQKLYRVGLIGVDQNGKKRFWGVVGGDGMMGRAGQAKDAATGSTYNALVVSPSRQF